MTGIITDLIDSVLRKLLFSDRAWKVSFGAWREASAHVDKLLIQLVKQEARRQEYVATYELHQRNLNDRLLAGLLRPRWGLTVVHENIRQKLERLRCDGREAGAINERRRVGAAIHLSQSYFKSVLLFFRVILKL